MAQVKLLFRSCEGKEALISRSMSVTQKAKNLQFKTLDTSIRLNPKEKDSVSYNNKNSIGNPHAMEGICFMAKHFKVKPQNLLNIAVYIVVFSQHLYSYLCINC